MIRKALLLSATFALAALPAQAQFFGGPGGTGVAATNTGVAATNTGVGSTNTGVTTTGTTTPVATSGCASTGGYVGHGDCLASTVTIQRYFAMRAMSYAAAQAGAYLGRIYGDGGTGDASTSVYADVRSKADGTPDFANAVLSSGAIGSILPGAGTVTTNPCFGGDLKCRVGILYDQSTQTTTASTSGAPAGQGTVANRPVLAQACSNATNVTNTIAKACLQSTPNQSLTDTSITAAAVSPFSLGYVGQRLSGSTAAYGLVGVGTASMQTYTPTGTWQIQSTARGTFPVTESGPAAVVVAWNAAASFIQANATTSSNQNIGNTSTGGTMYLMQQSGGGALSGISFEFSYETGTWDAAHLAADASNKSAYYGLGF